MTHDFRNASRAAGDYGQRMRHSQQNSRAKTFRPAQIYENIERTKKASQAPAQRKDTKTLLHAAGFCVIDQIRFRCTLVRLGGRAADPQVHRRWEVSQ